MPHLIRYLLPLLLLTQIAEASDMMWDVEELKDAREELSLRDDRTYRVHEDQIMLRDYQGVIKWRLPISQVRLMYSVLQQIEAVAEADASLYVIEGHEPNAAAAYREARPSVMVNFGLIDLIGHEADQWAALIGHEIAHLKLDHGSKNRKRSLPLSLLNNAVRIATPDPLVQIGSDFVTGALNAHYSRDQERESDYLGVIWAVQAGHDPYGAVRMHENMLARQGARLQIPFLNSHPSSKKRVRTLGELAARLGGTP